MHFFSDLYLLFKVQRYKKKKSTKAKVGNFFACFPPRDSIKKVVKFKHLNLSKKVIRIFCRPT